MSIISFPDSLGLCLCFFLLLVCARSRRRFPLPPGPWRWPFFGNTFMVPLSDPHIFFNELGTKLGTKILYFEALGQSILVLNDISVAQDLLDKRSKIYSSRPEFPMLNEVVGYDKFFALMPYGNEWRIHRRMFHQHFSGKNFPQIQDKTVHFIRKGLLPNFLEAPDDFLDHLRGCIAGLATSITYGLPVERRNDPLIQFTEGAAAGSAAAVAPWKFFVNVIPLLKHVPEWMPGAGFKQVAKQIREKLDQLENLTYEGTLKMMDDGTAPHSFVAETLERYRESPTFELHARYAKQTAVQISAAASATTLPALTTFMLAILIRPDIQMKVQHEIDSVVGLDRLPEYQDISDLPYLSAVVKEVLRWNPSTPMGVPHVTQEADVYMGYHIPRNCVVFANAYAMFRNEEFFPDPNEFKPERFITNGVLRDDLPDPEVVATFGFGRRICPGSNVARSTLYLAVASILHLFDITPALDADDNPIEVVPQFAPAAMISEPLPFPCRIVPRKDRDVRGLLKGYLGTDPI